MKHFFIVTNIQKDKDASLTNQLKEYIEKKGGTCSYYLSSGGKESVDCVSPNLLPKETECVLVLGGDGTLIRAARDLHEQGVPLIGVNLGTLGYLCELERANVYTAIDEIMQGNYMIERRMMLEGYCIVNGERTESQVAFNDIILHRSNQFSVKKIVLRVNGEYLSTYTADGMIIASPNGSTAYNLSAGGPIVDPKAELLLVTPINPHNLNSKSIVLSAEDCIEIEIEERNSESEEIAEASFDGDYPIRMGVGDKLFVRKAESSAQILKLSKLSFLENLSKKMQTYL